MFKLFKRVRIEKGPVVLGQPAVSPQAIYVGLDMIYRLDPNNFSTVWSTHHESCGVSDGSVIGDVLLIGNGWNRMIALDTDSGATVWSRDCAGGLVWQEQVLAFEPDSVVILDPPTGKALDRRELPGRSAVYDLKGDLLLYTKGQTNDVAVAYDLAERKILWERPLLEETKSKYGAPGESMRLAAGTKAVVLVKPDVGIFGCSKEDGRILWHQKAFVSSYVPVVDGGRIYALTQGLPMRYDFAKFLCFDELSGEKMYETEHEKLLTAHPSRGTVFDGHIAFGSRLGWILVFRLSDGELVWSHRTRGETWQPTIADNRFYITSDEYLLVFERKRSSRGKSQ